jgi:hypothetical protein
MNWSLQNNIKLANQLFLCACYICDNTRSSKNHWALFPLLLLYLVHHAFKFGLHNLSSQLQILMKCDTPEGHISFKFKATVKVLYSHVKRGQAKRKSCDIHIRLEDVFNVIYLLRFYTVYVADTSRSSGRDFITRLAIMTDSNVLWEAERFCHILNTLRWRVFYICLIEFCLFLSQTLFLFKPETWSAYSNSLLMGKGLAKIYCYHKLIYTVNISFLLACDVASLSYVSRLFEKV